MAKYIKLRETLEVRKSEDLINASYMLSLLAMKIELLTLFRYKFQSIIELDTYLKFSIKQLEEEFLNPFFSIIK